MLLKKIAAFAAAALACVSLAGCGSAKDITVDVNALAAELRDGIAYQDELESIDSAMISMVYDVGDEVEEAVVYMGSGATAEEIAVFACKDADAAKNQVTPVVKQHIEDQITSFESYVPGRWQSSRMRWSGPWEGTWRCASPTTPRRRKKSWTST